MKRITSLALVGIALGLAGCAYRPIVAGHAARDQRQVIRNCMTGRGYAVLN
jgi:hypothetical protein